MKSKFIIQRNDWDSNFFKEKIGNLEYSGTQNISTYKLAEILKQSLESARKGGFKYLVLTDGKGRRKLKAVLEKNNFELCDASVDFKMKLSSKIIKSLDDKQEKRVECKFARKTDLNKLRDISEKSFVRSRLYKVKFAKKSEVDKYHFIWVSNLLKEKNSRVLIIKNGIHIMGFLGFTMNFRQKSSRINLIAAKASSRGKGYGTKLINSYFKYVYEQGIRTLYVKTQQDNKGARNFYEKNGYAEYCFEEKYHTYL